MKKRIVVRPLQGDPRALGGLHPVLQRVYAGRGVCSREELALELSRLIPPARLGGIEVAARRVADRITDGGSILVVGDYDCDGATATALCVLALRAMGAAQVDYLVPSRFDFGYGLTPGLVEVAARQSPDLLLTVDNGVSSIEGVALARRLGMQVVITDHHLPGARLPEAHAIVDPNLPGDPFPAKSTAGVGVAFYLLSAVRAELRRRGWFDDRREPNLAQWLDLVALGTVADMVPLEYNNRILVREGLRRMAAGRCRPGILALLEVAGRRRERLSAADLGFTVGPRINAAGRLAEISTGIECLLTDDPARARELAERLDLHNRERRRIEEEMQQQALQWLEALEPGPEEALPWGLCLHDPRWHQGVVGLLASRIRERYGRPVVALAPGEGGALKGSARSIPGLHLRDALAEVARRAPGLMDKFGGHAMAAGLSLPRAHLERFRTLFDEVVRERLSADDLEPVLHTDGELTADALGLELAEILADAGPWGQGFPEPLFHGRFRVLHRRLLKEQHWKLVVEPTEGGPALDAIAFGQARHWPGPLPERLTLAYRLEVNEYRGRRNPQLNVVHLQPDEA